MLHLYAKVKTTMRTDAQSTMVIELEDGLRKGLDVESNLICAAGTERLPEQCSCTIGVGIEESASLALECRGTL